MEGALYCTLCDMISLGRYKFVSTMLQDHDDIDVTYSDGTLLRSAIEGNGNVAIATLLINYYETVQLPKLKVGSTEYNLLRYHFKTALEVAISGETLSTEMRSLLSRYIDFDSYERDSVPDAEDVDAADESHITLERSSSRSASDSHITAENLSHVSHGSSDTETWIALVGKSADSPEPTE
jgi:hypothetical protein